MSIASCSINDLASEEVVIVSTFNTFGACTLGVISFSFN